MIRALKKLEDLPPLARLTVVINCSTRLFTTLAVASVSRFSDWPVLIIDCASKDRSVEHFHRVFSMSDTQVYLCELPLKAHGATLDDLFIKISVPEILLLDSDVEILDGRIFPPIVAGLADNEDAYGAGLLQEGNWMVPPDHVYEEGVAWYFERMWIPLVLLRRSRVFSALMAGGSFVAHRDFLELPNWPRLSRLLGYRLRIKTSLGDKTKNRGPFIHEWDTGSKLHRTLIDQGVPYASIDPSYWGHVNHVHGVTRSQISGPIFRLAVRLGLISKNMLSDVERAEKAVLKRLAQHYPDFC